MVEPVCPTRILVPTDFSPGVEGAVGWAQALGSAFGAEVILLHVVDLSIAALAGFPSTLAAVPAAGDLLDRIRRESDDEMRRQVARIPGGRGIVREGSPRSMILEVAREAGVQLIVMGTHGRSGLTHVFFGSVAEHVVRHSHVPVLTVRHQG